ncbi:MAG: pilus assembly protein CpaE [Planctomycetes bacterium]|nr:pilus assembly protein CpaE [Planctomycetota bacterium]NBY03428.1 pilus assembly protein CpaE [Planctomycetota bacterium]
MAEFDQNNNTKSEDNLLRLVIMNPPDKGHEALRSMFTQIPYVWLQAECTKYEFLQDVIANQTTPHVVVVAIDADLEKACKAIERLAQEMPDVGILAISKRDDGQAILKSLRAGAKEFLTMPFGVDTLSDALRKLEKVGRVHKSPTVGVNKKEKTLIISFLGSRGGVGCTSLSVNIGATLAADPHNKVVLVDLDLALGDADIALDLVADYTLSDLIENIDKLDMTFLNRSLSKHSTGLALLPHPLNVSDATIINEDHLKRIISLLAACHTHLVLDLSKSLRPTDICALAMSDFIFLVVQLEITSIRNAIRLLSTLDADGRLGPRVKLVLNRVGMVTDITKEKAVELLGRPFFWEVPNDHKVMMESRNSGTPMVKSAPVSKIQQNFSDFADEICSKTKANKGAKSFWHSLFTNKS